MGLLKRFGYYLLGFSVGLIILAIFLKKKNTEFCYGIDCRVLKNIRSKNIVYHASVSSSMNNHAIDSMAINYILKNGNVDISKSNTTLDSCKVYVVDGEVKEKTITLTIENCNKKALIQNINIQ